MINIGLKSHLDIKFYISQSELYARAGVKFGNVIMKRFDIFVYILNFSLFP